MRLKTRCPFHPRQKKTRTRGGLNAPHSNIIWKEVKRIANEFDSDSLTLLEQFQDSTSARKPIVDEIYSYSHRIAINYGELFYWQGRDTTLMLERIIDSLARETDVQLQLLLADYYVADSMYSNAANIHNNLSVYNQDLIKLVQLKKHALTFAQNGWTWFDLVGEGQATEYMDSISAIASSDSSIAAFQAQVIMELVGADTIVRVYEEKSGSSKWDGNIENEQPKTAQVLSSNIRIYPNPAQNELILEYKSLNENNPTTVFTIFNLMGAKQYEITLSKATTHIDVSMLSNGMYLFVVSENGAHTNNGKLSIIK